MSDTEHQNRVAGGLKATLHNPNTSDEAKASAEERLKEMGATETTETDSGHLSTRQAAGYKAAINNPNVSDEARAHAEQVLQADSGDNTDPTRRAAGYKAALHNPNVGEEAKERAKEYLEEHNIPV